jgi:hypothetical protein
MIGAAFSSCWSNSRISPDLMPVLLLCGGVAFQQFVLSVLTGGFDACDGLERKLIARNRSFCQNEDQREIIWLDTAIPVGCQ